MLSKFYSFIWRTPWSKQILPPSPLRLSLLWFMQWEGDKDWRSSLIACCYGDTELPSSDVAQKVLKRSSTCTEGSIKSILGNDIRSKSKDSRFLEGIFGPPLWLFMSSQSVRKSFESVLYWISVTFLGELEVESWLRFLREALRSFWNTNQFLELICSLMNLLCGELRLE